MFSVGGILSPCAIPVTGDFTPRQSASLVIHLGFASDQLVVTGTVSPGGNLTVDTPLSGIHTLIHGLRDSLNFDSFTWGGAIDTPDLTDSDDDSLLDPACPGGAKRPSVAGNGSRSRPWVFPLATLCPCTSFCRPPQSILTPPPTRRRS